MILQIRQELETFLSQYGWQYRVASDDELQTGWQGENRSYPLKISISQTWISFKVQPFIGINIDWETWPEIAAHILELNDATNMVKLSMDEDGRIVMGLEIFVEDAKFDRLVNILGIIGHYAELIYEDLLSVLDQVGFRYCESLNYLA